MCAVSCSRMLVDRAERELRPIVRRERDGVAALRARRRRGARRAATKPTHTTRRKELSDGSRSWRCRIPIAAEPATPLRMRQKLSDLEIQRALGGLAGWSRRGDALIKTFTFERFADGIAFVGPRGERRRRDGSPSRHRHSVHEGHDVVVDARRRRHHAESISSLAQKIESALRRADHESGEEVVDHRRRAAAFPPRGRDTRRRAARRFTNNSYAYCCVVCAMNAASLLSSHGRLSIVAVAGTLSSLKRGSAMRILPRVVVRAARRDAARARCDLLGVRGAKPGQKERRRRDARHRAVIAMAGRRAFGPERENDRRARSANERHDVADQLGRHRARASVPSP